MVVGFVNSGIMKLNQAVGIIMGANIGTTITSWILSLTGIQGDNVFIKMLNPSSFSPILAIIGVFMLMLAKSDKKKNVGTLLTGFSILMFGMHTMSSAVSPLADVPEFTGLLVKFSIPVLGVLAGTILTAVIQSSSASVGILQALCATGSVSYAVAIPIIMGQNIGTCITAMLATVGTNKTAHRAAMLHLIFNVVGTIIFLPIIVPGFLGNFVSYFTTDVNRQIANAHTIFNVVNTLIMVPLIPILCKIVERIIPGEDDEKVGPKYIDDRLLETPVIAAGQVVKETIRMSNKAKLSLELAMDAFMKNDENLAEKVYENEEIINNLEECITNYLVKLSKCELSDKEKNIVASTFHIVNDIERIGDHAENLADLTVQKINKKLSYSDEAIDEITNMYQSTLKALDISIESYSDRDSAKAKEITNVEAEIDKMHKRYRDLHIKRLHEGTCNAYAGAIFLDLLSNLERIGDHSTNIAEIVVENNN